MDQVGKIVLVKSVKGGVGKSTISTQIALSLLDSGYKVGILDIDLCGPSIPYLLDLENSEVFQGENGRWIPIYKGDDKRLAVMSIAFLLGSRNDPVIWRGPKKTSMIKQFIQDIEWGDLDYLVVDTPPGTSDEHITVAECLKDPSNKTNCIGTIIVTTPQEVALEDTRKEITFCRKTNLHVIGILENMSGYECPSCSECSYIFASGGGEALSSKANVPLLGSLPIDPRVAQLSHSGQSAIKALPDSTTAKVLTNIVQILRDA